MTEASPDRRWESFVDVTPSNVIVPTTFGTLTTIADSMPTTASTPEGVAGLLETARALYSLAWFKYELLAVSATWGLLAVEAALRTRLGTSEKPSLGVLLRRAEREGLLPVDEVERLQAGRQLRNSLMHATSQSVWTPGMAASSLRAAHRVVTLLFPL